MMPSLVVVALSSKTNEPKMYLNCHSYHSLRYGTIPLQELVEQAVACNVKALALTDINTVTGIYDFIKACKAVHIKPIVGIEFRQNYQLLFMGLAKNKEGIGEMCRLLTKHNFDNTPLPTQAPEWNHVAVMYPMENSPSILRDYEYIGVRSEQLIKFYKAAWKAKLHKAVIWHPVTFRVKKEFNLHKILSAIDRNVILSKLTSDDYCNISEVMLPVNELLQKYQDYPESFAIPKT